MAQTPAIPVEVAISAASVTLDGNAIVMTVLLDNGGELAFSSTLTDDQLKTVKGLMTAKVDVVPSAPPEPVQLPLLGSGEDEEC